MSIRSPRRTLGHICSINVPNGKSGFALNSSSRLEAARHFLSRTRDDTLGDRTQIWYSQATVVFAIAATEILVYDFAEIKHGEQLAGPPRDVNYFEAKYGSQTDFYRWLEKKESKYPLYRFLRNERNMILHRGQLDKNRVSGSNWAGSTYFVGWNSQSVDVACQELCDWVDSLIYEAQQRYSELR